ncbi:dihydroxyacetone kinase subunit DhaK [Ramlibacter sp. AW1]|uniref:Dihydroxyacetone kinase subunit DhaK n=1 Tax=Ramlibacter aurantiacus TaxID=2801330 RepID=A0A936ZSM2_9BURK|nr:dihydroxyacetone kinase family protein [Ramlibacter aurantiacus]MBL0422956.1 dihydroxyacetone kinase subunit DhaK [Ramlibacter aurantiacus]
MKKLLNDIRAVVPEMLEGLAMLHPGIALLQGHDVALRADVEALKARGEVALVCGGGSGHEPAHAGYVGPGMLTAAVAGEVFTSPSTDAVLEAIEAVAGPGGVLLIVKNYTGDRLNFGLAAEIARSRGHAVEMVVVDDDAALAAGGAHAGRRGIAGTVLVHKVAGAAAARGESLAQVRRAALDAIASLASMGVALGACTVPAAGGPGFQLGPREVELGLGIHGEAGARRVPLQGADALVRSLLDTLLADRALRSGERVALLVNNLGGTPAQELAIVARAAIARLHAMGLRVERAWCGTFLTALEMPGVSLSLMRLNDGRLAALDAPTTAPAWPAAHLGPVRTEPLRLPAHHASPVASHVVGSQPDAALAAALRAVAQMLEEAEPELTRLDQQVGDGDLGISLARGARALRESLPGYPLDDLPATLRALSATLRRVLGGTSGPLYAIGLLCAAASLDIRPRDVGAALQAAADGIAGVGGAREGDCTMLDALYPAVRAAQGCEAPLRALAQAARAAQEGAQATAGKVARQGRASYLGERGRPHMDPGARALALWLEALARHLA